MAASKIALTDAKLKHLRPQKKTFELRDAGAPGLRVRIYPSGRIVFRWMAKDSTGRNIIQTLGTYPHTTLAKARAELETIKERHAKSLESGRMSGEDALRTVKDLAEVFYARRIKPHRKRPDAVRSVLDRHIIPVIGTRTLASLTTATCRVVVEKVVDGGATTHAGKVLAILKQMLDFAASRGDLAQNPAAPLRADNFGIRCSIKDRALSGDELRQLWTVLDTVPRLSIQTRLAIKILALTGVRTGELLRARWENVDLDARTWVIPVTDQKLSLKQMRTGKPFVVPLAPQVAALFRAAKQAADAMAREGNDGKDAEAEYVMASDSKEGHLSDKALGHVTRSLFKKKTPDGKPLMAMPSFSPHDLRRTLRTQIGEVLKVPPHIAERCLNHSLGRIVATYDTGDYLDERRAALTKWANLVDEYTNNGHRI